MKENNCNSKGSVADAHGYDLNQPLPKAASTRWVFVDQVMRRLRISRSTVYRWVQKGYLKAYRFDGSHILYFDLDEIEQLIRGNAILSSRSLDEIALKK